MNEMVKTASFDLAGAMVAFGLNFLAQSAVLIGAGLLAARLLQRFGASAQSAIYRVTLVAMLVCPACSTAFSGLLGFGWNIPTPSVWASSADPVRSQPVRPNQPTETQARKGESVTPLDAKASRWESQSAEIAGFSAVPVAVAAKRNESQGNTEDLNRSRPLAAVSVFGWLALASCLVWFAGSVCRLIRLAWGWRRLWRIRNTAVAADEETNRACEELAATLKVAPPRVYKTPFLPGPCLAGYLHPVILIPEWEHEAPMRDILIHELAHLRRRDSLWNLLRQLATAVFFFQPVLWQLSRKLEITAEEVCDDWVVELGADRQTYAHTLADVAQWSAVPMAWPSVAMAAKRSLLGQRVRRILDRSRPLSTSVGRPFSVGVAVAACLAVLVVGLAAAGPSRIVLDAADEITIEPSPKSEIAAAIQEDGKVLPSIEKTGNSVTVRGRVLKPDGKPASGAKITLRHWNGSLTTAKPVIGTTMTQDDGRFTVSCRFAPERAQGAELQSVELVAESKDLGIQWISGTEWQPSKPLVLSLIPDTAIHGRIVDAQANPIAGVQVGVIRIGRCKQGEDLKPWIETVRAGGDNNAANQKLDRALFAFGQLATGPVLTDQDGRFTVNTMGSESVVDLELQGATIAHQRVTIATRKLEPIERTLWPYSGLGKPPIRDRVFGADFTYAAVPTRILEGTIRDAATKQALPNVIVQSHHLAGMLHGFYNGDGVVRTVTDAQGRYRLAGLPKGEGPEIADLNEIWVLPQSEAPYFKRAIRVPAAKGDGPQTLDIEMHKGIWIHGRVSEKGTGKPVRARVSYLPLRDNPHIRQMPEFHEDTYVGVWDGLTSLTDQEGRYRLSGMPGQAIVAAMSIQGKYLRDIGAEKVPAKDKDGNYPTIGIPHFGASPNLFHSLIVIDPKNGSAEAPCDLVLDPGETLRVAVVDPAGKPVPGCTLVNGHSPGFDPAPSAEIEIANLVPGQPRDIAVFHKERNLGKIVKLTWKPDTPRTIPVTIEPCATIKGKVVDEEGKPFKILEVLVTPSKEVGVYIGSPMIFTNADGTFECPRLPVGCKNYSIYVMGSEIENAMTDVAKNIEIQAGKTVEIGVVKVKRKK